PVAHILWLPAVAIAAWGAATFPVLPGLLIGLLAAAAFVVRRQPQSIFFIVPAALPVLDLAPWSGRLLVDEFDLLLLATLATAYLSAPARAAKARDPILRVATMLLALTFAIGVLRGMLPWQGVDGFAVESLQGPLNALRIGKGALWAWLACDLWRRFAASGARPHR